MRVLDRHGVSYADYYLEDAEGLSGLEVALSQGQDPSRSYKTLVTSGRSGGHYVFMIPVGEELDLKKAARAAGEKSIEMIPSRELLPLTGYVHGGCSPIGMKKQFPTFLDSKAEKQEKILFSAGKIGRRVEIRPEELKQVIPVTFAELTED